MSKLISCCGLDCASCDAFIATLNNDNELRKTTAEKWKTMHNAPQITAEMINCTGCRQDGVKFNHCDNCEIRSCAKSKNFDTCADCVELDSCQIVGQLHIYVPVAKENLLLLKN